MSTHQQVIEQVILEVPEGFRATGELRYPRKGEYYLKPHPAISKVAVSDGEKPNYFCWILEKVRPRAKHNGLFYCIIAGVKNGLPYVQIGQNVEQDGVWSREHYTTGNYFLDKTEAQKVADKLNKAIKEAFNA